MLQPDRNLNLIFHPARCPAKDNRNRCPAWTRSSVITSYSIHYTKLYDSTSGFLAQLVALTNSTTYSKDNTLSTSDMHVYRRSITDVFDGQNVDVQLSYNFV